MADERQLLELIGSSREGVLAGVTRSGTTVPQTDSRDRRGEIQHDAD